MLPGLKKRALNFHDLLIYVAIARRHVRLMVLLLCFSWLAGLVYYVYARPVYFSRSLIRMDLVEQPINAEKQFKEPSRITRIILEMNSPHIIQRTAARLGVKADYRDITKHQLKKLVLRPNSEKNIEVEVYPYSYDWAKRWSEAMIKEYDDYRFQRRLAELKQRKETFDRNREEMLKLMDEELSHLFQTRADSNTVEAKIEFDKLRMLHRDIVETGIRLDEIGRAKLQLMSEGLDPIAKLSIIYAVSERLQIGTAAGVAPVNEGGQEPQPGSVPEIVTPSISSEGMSWRNFERQLDTLKVEREKLAEKYLPGHSAMIALQRAIDDLNLKVEGELRTAEKRLDATHEILIARQKVNQGKRPEYERAMKNSKKANLEEDLNSGAAEKWKRRIERFDSDMDLNLYAFDLNRVDLSFGGILHINDLPVSPNRFTLIIYSTLLGLFLAIGIPFLIEFLDHTLSNLEQVESSFQMRGLGIIPKIDGPPNAVGLMDHDAGKEKSLLENFRVIRTNVLSMGALSKAPHVIMVTSAMPKEGKTVVSSNLALSFAQTGARTLILDTDLRRGRLHRLFGYRKQPGLSGVLLGTNSLADALRPTPHQNLTLLSAGQHLEAGTELLGSQQFHDIMADLRQRFDRIIIDTPPVLGLSETSVLQSQVDGVLFVIWSGHTPVNGVKAAIEMLQANGANFYGFVLNRLDLSATANYYQYYYYSHDYYYHYSPRALENA